MFGQVYTYPDNPRFKKIQAAANLNNLIVTEAPNFQMMVTNRTPEFLSKFPLGKAPAFEGADGTLLFESDAIAQYVAESGPAKDQLLGVTAAERAVIRQWISFAEGEAMGAVVMFAVWAMKLMPYDEAAEKKNLEKLERALGAVETYLGIGEKKFIAGGEKLSLADISLVAGFYWGFTTVIDEEMRARFPRVIEWYTRIIESEGVKEAFGEKKFLKEKVAFV
ncbi:glutathione S-transferase [Aspergillus avenaceus]|uniref:Glutathione S-transferase n=1 Tax=Aspergillus avenaceus TaxID=36643 RepID=A0A5N6TZN1_ASPAV|nr:glutathione S-transferase [Aspergillus avenaceus]